MTYAQAIELHDALERCNDAFDRAQRAFKAGDEQAFDAAIRVHQTNAEIYKRLAQGITQ